MTRNFHIRELPEDERPREKLQRNGVVTLTNPELIAILLRTGTRRESSLDLAMRVIQRGGPGIRFLADLTFEEYCELPGIGPAKACQVMAALELGKRLRRDMNQHKPVKMDSPKKIAEYLMDELMYLKKEKFVVVFLDTKNQIINYEVVSVGTLNASIVHPREVFNLAVKKSANAIVLVHNHPSGNCDPSREDLSVTERIRDCGDLLGISVLDHVIIGAGKYYSFKEAGLI
jgi:DNA repair protein RadC